MYFGSQDEKTEILSRCKYNVKVKAELLFSDNLRGIKELQTLQTTRM